MLYHLLFPLADRWPVLNVFQYLSFRAAAATATALIVSFVVGPCILRGIQKRGWGQVVRAEGPAAHLGKAGTPTMGGLIILTGCIVPVLLWARLDNRLVLIAAAITLCLGAVGFMDDYLKIVRRQPRGLIARYKMISQVALGGGLGLYLLLDPISGYGPSQTMMPFFKDVSVVLAPWAFPAFTAIVIAGSSNTVNLTDGLDGLATGLAALAVLTFGVFAYAIGRVDMSSYLGLFYVDGAGELAIFCAAMAGAAIGFLWFNAPPAQVFMGDTGSLALGGALGAVAILLKAEFLLPIVGGVFVLEGISVMAQTTWFRYTRHRFGEGRRLFLMAPLHHHFEKLGWPETKVVVRFYILGILCALAGLATLKIR
ncbi:MAG: phospho-N-acetylmuramoyl-pentapeptide-transferase [Gemmatimonadetes bacterium]|nr:phospho-N-acetylmuramoyl-pentapeptide-transferase [Gemmatimonadota bacterium]